MYDGFCGEMPGSFAAALASRQARTRLQPLRVVTCSDIVTGRHARRTIIGAPRYRSRTLDDDALTD